MSTLKEQLPWTSSPLIMNAPMAGFAGGKLASAVTLAGGLGMIGGLFNMEDVKKELRTAAEAFKAKPDLSTSRTLPVGLGFLPFVLKLHDILPVIEEFKPAVVWLFVPKSLDDFAEWVSAIRKVSPESKIWIQLGSVTAALHVAKIAQPDVLCLQGADAGGHGFEKGASIVSLLPEASDALAAGGFSRVPIIASGGIADGRGVAAALTLGAEGVVMGTRFLASEEVNVHPVYQAAVLEAQDGGQVTTRSKLFDQLRGPNIWPELYDTKVAQRGCYRRRQRIQDGLARARGDLGWHWCGFGQGSAKCGRDCAEGATRSERYFGQGGKAVVGRSGGVCGKLLHHGIYSF
jgi:nitronate monooxygenase